MDSLWHYYENGERRGPVPLSSLLAALSAQAFPREVQVWREGMAEWQAAGTVPEISRQLPPPPQSAPPSLPGAAPTLGMHRKNIPFSEAVTIAHLYRRLVLLVGAQILLAIGRGPLFLIFQASGSTIVVGLIALAYLGAVLATAILIVIAAYRLAGHIASTPVVWAIAMFVPCVNIIGLLILSSKAQDWCRQYGIKVGLLGPSLESIEELRRASTTSAFD